jgi:predicted HD superfamily hydrolase involved in NAD metabolism
MTIDCTALEAELKETISTKRFMHSLSVSQTCVDLAHRYREQLDENLLRACGLMHDMAREWTDEQLLSFARKHMLHLEAEELEYPVLLHAPVAAQLLKERGFPPELCLAVRHHSLGSKEMGRMGLVLYLADYLEPNRSHLDDQLRERLLKAPSLEALCVQVMEMEGEYLKKKGKKSSEVSMALKQFLQAGGRL